MSKKEICLIIFLSLLLNSFQKANKKVFESTKIKKLNLKNRIFRASVTDNCFFQNGHISNEAYKYYDQLSKEGSSIIFTGCSLISRSSLFEKIGRFLIDKDDYIEEFKKLTDIVHKNNVNLIMQIIHSGELINNGIEIAYGPSNVFNPLLNTTNKELTKEDILKIEEDFVNSAVRAKKFGFDGIDIHSAHLTLLNQFLSPAFNKRNDEYGGNDENRARIIVEIIEKIRKAVGNDFIISIKISVNDGIENGINENGFLTACKLIEKAGADLIQTSGNYVEHKIKPKNPIFYEQTNKIAEVVNIPVVLTGGIRDMETMEEILNKSKIQYFGFGRPLLCEPDIIKRWEKGERCKSKCITCNSCVRKSIHSCSLNKKKKK